MTIYGTIKAAISVKQAAEHYGLKVNRNGMACCPFHNDRHPSLKLNEDYFFCFGCGAKGDVIDLVARLFNRAAMKQRKSWLRTSDLTRNRPLPQLWPSQSVLISVSSGRMKCCVSGC